MQSAGRTPIKRRDEGLSNYHFSERFSEDIEAMLQFTKVRRTIWRFSTKVA